MWISVTFVLIALVILLLAFVDVFGRFPDNWEWVGIVLAGVGLAMASPSILRMFWGRPLVKTRFENGVEEAERFLPVYLENPPVKNRILRKLGVRRDTVQSLTVQFRISEVGSGKIVIPIRQARIYSDDDATDEGRNRIALPPTFSVAASVMIVQWNAQKNKALIPPDRLREEFALGAGHYQVDIILSVDGDPMLVSRQFVVGQKADDLSWINPN